MRFHRGATLLALWVLAPARAAAAGEAFDITLETTLELARERAADTAGARLRVDEARGRLEGASVFFRDNPVAEVGIGPRLGASGTAVEAAIEQTLELGGGRSARMDAARAGVERAEAASDDAARRTLRDAGIAFYRAFHAQELLALAGRVEELAGATARIAERRHEAGEVPPLHVNLARGALARARSDTRAAEAELAATLGELRILTGLDAGAPIRLRGSLAARDRFERVASAQEVRERPDLRVASAQEVRERPDLRVAAAELREAAADRRLGRSLAWPELAIGVQYTAEEAESAAVLGTIGLSLPIFERGQGVRAEALARERRLELELGAARRRAEIEAASALAVYRKRVESAAALETALPGQEQSETLARRSYELGELGLAELLLVRREVLETRIDFLGRQLAAAIAGIELEAATGALK